MNNPIIERNQKCAKTAVEAFKKRHFDAYYCETKEDALKTALALIPGDHQVSWGGCKSMADIGLADALARRGQPVLDRAAAKSPEESREMMRTALLCDSYILSANAASMDGQLVNIDGNGNRVAALCYGPKQVVVILGVNKLEPDLDSAIRRARFIAAPVNAQRFDLSTPCKQTGRCADCLCPDSICAQMVITRLCRPAGRIKILVVAEELGF